jgi:hypothetical protein
MLASSIAVGLTNATLKTVDSKMTWSAHRVELPPVGSRHHDWWVVPKLVDVKRDTPRK